LSSSPGAAAACCSTSRMGTHDQDERSRSSRRTPGPRIAARARAERPKGQQDLWRRACHRGRRLRPLCRRSACAGGRKRRRQIDALQGHRRRHQTHVRQLLRRRQAGRFPVAARCALLRHLHGLSGDESRADHDGGTEYRARQRKADHAFSHAQHRRAAAVAIAQLPRRSRYASGAPRHRQATDGGDRARHIQQSADHHFRRTDRQPNARGNPAFLQSGTRSARTRGGDHLHFARARGITEDFRSHYRAARRQARGHRQDRGHDPREARALHGRPRHHADTAGIAARTAPAMRAKKFSPSRM
jgi:hypothetical protein